MDCRQSERQNDHGDFIVLKKLFAGVALLFLAVCPTGSAQSSRPARADEAPARSLVGNEGLYRDKVHAAWLGKLIGLIAGQPTEGWGREEIERKARAVGFYPITGYMPTSFDTPAKNFLLGNFDGSPPNDDSDLMLASLLALREHGIELTDRNLADTWLKYVPGACTAELVALRNFQKDIWPPESAKVGNPYQEMIGAQMRGEIWGMIAPGLPDAAARYARLDASLTHTGNGTYGEQFIAAAVSVAMVEKDRAKMIERALETIPADSAYAEAIRDAIRWHRTYREWQGAWEQLDRKWGFLKNGKRDDAFTDARYNTNKDPYLWKDIKWVYADVNGAAVTLALLYGDGDFSRSVCLAVMLGYDNDCNAGTVGAVLGAMHGTSVIADRWKAPLRDTYHTTLNLAEKSLKISAIAAETAQYGKQLIAQRAGSGSHNPEAPDNGGGRREANALQPIPATAVTLHGEIGRRIDLTVQRNVLAPKR